MTFINGMTASAVASPGDWPPQQQVAQLRLQLELLQAWAEQSAARAPARGRRSAARRPGPTVA